MWSAVSFAKRLATVMRRARHANGLGRFALVVSSVKTRFLTFVPSVVHLWVLRLAIQLPGINPALADTIRQYVNGPTTSSAPQASYADTSKAVSGPLSNRPSAMSSFLRNVALAPAQRGAKDFGQRAPKVDGVQNTPQPPPVFSLPVKHIPGSSDAAERPAQVGKTRPAHEFVPWLARKPHSFTPHEVDPACFHNNPLAGTYFAGGSLEHDGDTRRHETYDVEPTCFSNRPPTGASSSGDSLAQDRDTQSYGTSDRVASSEDVTRRLCDLRAPLDPHLITVVTPSSELSDDEDYDDDTPYYLLEDLHRCKQALLRHQLQLSPELDSSSEDMSSGAEDEELDSESDKENVPPLVRSILEAPTSVADYSSEYDPLFASELVSRLHAGPSVTSSISGAALGFDDISYATTDRGLASSETSEADHAAPHEARLPLVDLAISPASSTSSASTRVADDDDLGYGSDFGSRDSSPLPEAAVVRSLYERSYEPPTAAVFLQFGDETAYIVKLLGAGAYGRAYLLMSPHGPSVVKVVSKRHAYGYYGEPGRQLALNELKTWKVVTESNRPFLARLMCSHDDSENIYFRMRLHNGTLGDRLRHGKKLRRREVRLYSAELISALASLQELGIMHMDIKPDNIHITPDGHLALADFGGSHMPPNRPNRKPIAFQNRRTFTPAGTPGYWAPEVRVMDSGKGIKPSCDVYSLGIVILEMILDDGHAFFAAETPGEEAINEQMRTKPIPFEHVSDLDTDLADMLKQMLCDSPRDRATPAALKAHPYVRELFERGLESGLINPFHITESPWKAFEFPSVDMDDFRRPFANLASNAVDTEAAHARYVQLNAIDSASQPYDYACPAQYWSLAISGWPAPTFVDSE